MQHAIKSLPVAGTLGARGKSSPPLAHTLAPAGRYSAMRSHFTPHAARAVRARSDSRLSPRSLGLLTHLPCPSGHESTAAGYRAQGTGDTRVQPRPLRRAAASGASHAAPVTRRRGCMCHPARRPLMSPIHHTHTRRRALPRQRTLSTAINSSTAHRPPAPPVASTPSLHPLSLERLSPGRPSSPPAMSSRAVAAGRRGAQTRRSQSS